MEEEKKVSINQKLWYKILQSQTQTNKFVHNNYNLLTSKPISSARIEMP